MRISEFKGNRCRSPNDTARYCWRFSLICRIHPRAFLCEADGRLLNRGGRWEAVWVGQNGSGGCVAAAGVVKWEEDRLSVSSKRDFLNILFM